jgi:uncharacterized protein YidB (DUF937 family)
MGLFDSIAGQVLGSLTQGGGEHGGLLEAVGGVIASWVGTGQNQPISPEQLQSVLGSQQVQALAQQLGFSPQDALGKLAEFLPQLVDKSTPGGVVPEGGAVNIASLLGMLGDLKR